MKQFDIPTYYRSSFIGRIKEARKEDDPRKKDFTPTTLDFGPVRFHIARHFGFCYGVENAIEISYKALEENPGKRIFLLSQMIHNPLVNGDLEKRGIRFIMDTEGKQFIEWEELTADDIVIIPAFGTTLEIEKRLADTGIEEQRYNTTCPFVEKVWKQSSKLGAEDYSVIIHGKHKHEETRATFSHSKEAAPSVIVRDIEEARILGDIILGNRPLADFEEPFRSTCSKGFDPEKDLQRVGVVNQTTMLASETQEIADYFRQVMINQYGPEGYKTHFADTRDTLCYATNDNQEATYGLLKQQADLAIVVGGYNSSNTSHIVELCEQQVPTFFISSAAEIKSREAINHYNFHKKEHLRSNKYLPARMNRPPDHIRAGSDGPDKEPVDIILTSGASCPDTLVDEVLEKILGYFEGVRSKEEVLVELTSPPTPSPKNRRGG